MPIIWHFSLSLSLSSILSLPKFTRQFSLSSYYLTARSSLFLFEHFVYWMEKRRNALKEKKTNNDIRTFLVLHTRIQTHTHTVICIYWHNMSLLSHTLPFICPFSFVLIRFGQKHGQNDMFVSFSAPFNCWQFSLSLRLSLTNEFCHHCRLSIFFFFPFSLSNRFLWFVFFCLFFSLILGGGRFFRWWSVKQCFNPLFFSFSPFFLTIIKKIYQLFFVFPFSIQSNRIKISFLFVVWRFQQFSIYLLGQEWILAIMIRPRLGLRMRVVRVLRGNIYCHLHQTNDTTATFFDW